MLIVGLRWGGGGGGGVGFKGVLYNEDILAFLPALLTCYLAGLLPAS